MAVFCAGADGGGSRRMRRRAARRCMQTRIRQGGECGLAALDAHLSDDKAVAKMRQPASGGAMSPRRDMNPVHVVWLFGEVDLDGLEAGHVGEAVGILERDHPAGVLGREGADLVELLELVGGELEFAGGDVLVQLIETL